MTPTSALNSVFSHPASRFRERTISMATRAQATCWSSSYPTAWAHPIRHPYKVQGNLGQLAIVIEGASLTAFGCVNSRLASYHAGTVVPEWVSSFYSLIFIFLFLTLSSFSLKCILYNVKCTNTKWNFYICTCLTTTQTKIYSASPQVLSYSLQVISPKGNLT